MAMNAAVVKLGNGALGRVYHVITHVLSLYGWKGVVCLMSVSHILDPVSPCVLGTMLGHACII